MKLNFDTTEIDSKFALIKYAGQQHNKDPGIKPQVTSEGTSFVEEKPLLI